MPPKNSKAAAALEKKAVVEAGKASAKKSLVEAAESQSWKSGSKDLSAKENEENKRVLPPQSEHVNPSGIDGAMDLLSLATKGTDACNNDKLERHPEKRVKSAFAAFEEREMALLKEENPSLRLSQLKQALQKKWKKSPENPMNQAHVAFDTTRDEEKDAISAKREDALSHYKTQK
ncbi:hypothetical protein BSLG_001094 [Batrachochytrium salamandrivorans]|nr:hypothetical protein BSLG_001094 [Batrachochytrium salamandrivorans]